MRAVFLLPLVLSACTLFPNEDDALDAFDDFWGGEPGYDTPALENRAGVLDAQGGAWASTTGIAPGPRSAWLGMGYVLCEAEYGTGYFTADTSPEDGAESDLTDFDDDVVVAMSSGSVSIIQRVGGRTQTERVPRVQQAHLFDGGVIVIQALRDFDGCTADNGDDRWDVPEEACQDPLASDATPEGEVWVVTADGTTSSTPASSVDHPAQGDRIALDPERKVVYVARSAAGEVDAWTTDGALLWTTTLAGPVLDLRASVARGSVVALVQEAQGARALVELAWDSGAVTELTRTTSPVAQVAISPAGDWFSLADEGAAYFLNDASR